MLEGFGISEENWRDFCSREPSFGISESPAYVARAFVRWLPTRIATALLDVS